MKQITAIHFSRGSGAVVFLTPVIWSYYMPYSLPKTMAMKLKTSEGSRSVMWKF